MSDIIVSSVVDTMLQAVDKTGIRNAIDSVNYPFTTDIRSTGTVTTQDLTSVTSSSGFFYANNVSSIHLVAI